MIHIVTDSTCEGPKELLTHPAVHVVPLYLSFGKESFRDGVEISSGEFWRRLPRSNPLPTTSQATPGDFAELFEHLTAKGDEAVAVVVSNKLSGTYDSAMMAKEGLPGRRIQVVNSLSVSVGLGLMVQQAVAMLDAGASSAEIVAKMLAMRDKVHILFALETLEYIQKGGRIGRAQAFVGTLLKFKPLLGINEGEVYPVTRVRSKRKALETMLDQLSREVLDRGPQVKLGVVQACADEEAAALAQQMTARFESPHIFIGMLGPVLGVHVGPGTIGAVAYADSMNTD